MANKLEGQTETRSIWPLPHSFRKNSADSVGNPCKGAAPSGVQTFVFNPNSIEGWGGEVNLTMRLKI